MHNTDGVKTIDVNDLRPGDFICNPVWDSKRGVMITRWFLTVATFPTWKGEQPIVKIVLLSWDGLESRSWPPHHVITVMTGVTCYDRTRQDA